MIGILSDMDAAFDSGWFIAARFRDRVDSGRKVAIQILEFFDRNSVTIRRGDIRRLNRRKLDLFGDLAQGKHHRPEEQNEISVDYNLLVARSSRRWWLRQPAVQRLAGNLHHPVTGKINREQSSLLSKRFSQRTIRLFGASEIPATPRCPLHSRS